MRHVVLILMLLASTAGSADEAPPLTFVVERFSVAGDNPLDATATETALAPFAGEHAGMEGLLAARDALEMALRTAGHGFHRVVLPPQTLSGGVVMLEIVPIALGEVRIAGNRHSRPLRSSAACPA